MFRRLLCVILIIYAIGTAFAQNAHVSFDRFDVFSGLPDANALAIKQDARGYMWMGTQSGLVRFDGYRYKIYYLGNKNTNPYINTYIYSILVNGADVWVSTLQNGLFKYDPYSDSFTQFKYPAGTIDYFVMVNADKNKDIWGRVPDTKTGRPILTKFDAAKMTFQLFGPHQKAGSSLKGRLSGRTTVAKRDNSVWIPTNNGIYRYNEDKNDFTGYLTNSDTTKQLKVTTIYEAPSQQGIFWMNVTSKDRPGSRLVKWDSKANLIKEYPSYKPGSNGKMPYVTGAYEDKHKQLWFGTDTGLLKFDRGTETFSLFTEPEAISHDKKVRSIVEDGAGLFWMNTLSGLFSFDPQSKQFENFALYKKVPNELALTTINDIYVDDTGIPWIGTQWHGAFRINPVKSAFTVYDNADIRAAAYSGEELHFINKNDTAVLLRDSHQVYEGLPGSGNFKMVYALPGNQNFQGVISCTDGLWYMATSAGLRVYNPVKKTSVLYSNNPMDPSSIPANDISNICQQKNTTTLWVGTVGEGICSFDMRTKKFRRFPFRNTKEYTTSQNSEVLDDSSVQAIYEGRDGTMWIGSDDGGLNRYDKNTGKFHSYYTRENRGIVCIFSIREDNLGRLWICTYHNGLYLFDIRSGKVTHHFDSSNGLLFNYTISTEEDKAGNMWLLSPRGMAKINIKTLAVTNFRINDILPGYEVTNAGLGQVTCMEGLSLMPNGSILIPLKTAIAVFSPGKLPRNPYPPKVLVEQVEFNNPLAGEGKGKTTIPRPQQTLYARYNENRVTFTYVALHYDAPANNKYAYKLDGYDKTWLHAGTNRSATYTNLSPGTYTFHVIAANSSGVWNYKGDSIVIIIASPWWVRWWAWLIYIVVFALSLYAFISHRARALKRENLVLEEKVNIRTKQLHEQQEEITAQRDQLTDANKELSEQQEEITAQRDQLSESLSQLKITQRQLIQSEKLASLGELTAGIAHEIQNPLNFVNNFSEVSAELIDELDEELAKGGVAEARLIAGDVKQNLEKVRHHGHRADSIVKSMLEHSRVGTREKEPTDINKIADEFLRLAYHGLRAKDKSFNSELVTEYQAGLPPVNAIAQDIGRVLLNIFNNAFYAVHKRKAAADWNYKPEVKVGTELKGNWVEITVTDNGVGIPKANLDKIMQPFFTTKPTGEGTGLGLSLSYDIVTKGHGGEILTDSKEGEFTEFTVKLPLA